MPLRLVEELRVGGGVRVELGIRVEAHHQLLGVEVHAREVDELRDRPLREAFEDEKVKSAAFSKLHRRINAVTCETRARTDANCLS